MYDNMLYAQIDVVCAGIKALGHTDVQVRISKTGWPSKGYVDESKATVKNVGIYNRNLLQRMQQVATRTRDTRTSFTMY
ncbi:glucan endo-1,3-beta-glucosidase 14-like protein [Tanacetum coccineum]